MLRVRSKILCFLLTLFVCQVSCYCQIYNPGADSNAIVVSGNVRFTVLTPRVIRMEWSDDGKFEDNATLVFVNRKLPVPHFEHQDSKGMQRRK